MTQDKTSRCETLDSICDRVFALCFTGYRYRHPRLLAELDRVGLLGKTDVVWQFPNPYHGLLASKIPHISFLDSHLGCWGAIWGNYNAIKTGFHLGYDRILIVEDDCRFLKDASAIDSALSSAPYGWDVLMLDHFRIRGYESKTAEGRWTACRASASTACYVMNRKAMERFILMYESPVSGKYANPMMRNCDHWTDKRYIGSDIRLYCATPNLAVQCTCPGESNCGRLHCLGKYESLGISLSNYSEF